MIRIIDEPIFSMTKDEYHRLLAEYNQWVLTQFQAASFETWLQHYKAKYYTTYQVEHP